MYHFHFLFLVVVTLIKSAQALNPQFEQCINSCQLLNTLNITSNSDLVFYLLSILIVIICFVVIGTDIFDSDFTEEVGLELELPSFMKMIRGEGRDGFEADLELEKKSLAEYKSEIITLKRKLSNLTKEFYELSKDSDENKVIKAIKIRSDNLVKLFNSRKDDDDDDDGIKFYGLIIKECKGLIRLEKELDFYREIKEEEEGY